MLALGGGAAQAAPGEAPAVGRVVSVRAVPPAPGQPPVAEASATRPTARGGATVGGVASPPTPIAHSAAATHGASISDFAFHPGSITVTAGDTISWTNEDSAPHTATADDGSFDTGQLAKGASGSHTFATAGTFAYHCAIHPSMHGTVTVVAATSSAGSGTTATPSPAPSPAPSTVSVPGTLPRTGWDPTGVAATGVALLLAGLALRLRTRPR